jgi:hypothetical protein
MYASAEYLLCGIPVAAAVHSMKASQKDPYVIRERTLELMKRDRAAFIAHVNSIIRSKSMDHDIGETWNNWFVHKMRRELYADEIAGTLNASVAPKPTY